MSFRGVTEVLHGVSGCGRMIQGVSGGVSGDFNMFRGFHEDKGVLYGFRGIQEHSMWLHGVLRAFQGCSRMFRMF